MSNKQGTSTREEVLGDGNNLSCDTINLQLSFLLGRVLTIIDASISDKTQNKAIKDLVKGEFSDKQTHIYQLCYPGEHFLTGNTAKSIVADYDTIGSDSSEVNN